MPTPNQPVVDFLLSRRSRPWKTLQAPAPSAEDLRPMLTAAARSPDHGKLEPWRFVVLEAAAMQRLAGAVAERGAELGKDEETVEKARLEWASSPLAVLVISSPKDSPKIPHMEQVLSAGAVCLALLNVALASGWGANWLSGWVSHDRTFVETSLGLAAHENVAGVLHIGTASRVPPERPRPDVEAITDWIRA